MDEEMRKIAAGLRAKPSNEVADWLLLHYPEGGDGIVLLEHVSLRRGDYRRLAKHYFAGPTHAHGRAYRLFANRLGLGDLVRILGKNEGRNARDADLLAYHLMPLVEAVPDTEEGRTARAFVETLTAS